MFGWFTGDIVVMVLTMVVVEMAEAEIPTLDIRNNYHTEVSACSSQQQGLRHLRHQQQTLSQWRS